MVRESFAFIRIRELSDGVVSKERLESETSERKEGATFESRPVGIEIYLGLGFCRIFSARKAGSGAQFRAHYLGISARRCLRRLRRGGA